MLNKQKSMKLVIKLMGGLGNQMFQYATARSFALRNDADLVMDMRFLKNPYFVPELKNLDGESQAVKEFILSNRETKIFLEKYLDLLDYLIPLYKRENKAYLTFAIGCTGGRHRSVVVARNIFEYLNINSNVLVFSFPTSITGFSITNLHFTLLTLL